MTEPLRILFLAANPSDNFRLDLESEHRLLRNSIHGIAGAGICELLIGWATRPTELQLALERYKPHIVHFAGHGDDSNICLENDEGRSCPLSKEQLSLLFNLSLEHLRVVVLNTCCSAPQMESLSELIDYVIGTNIPVTDVAAMLFTANFYQSLAVGSTVRDAVHKAQSQLARSDERDKAGLYKLLVRSGVDETRPLLPPFKGNRIQIRSSELKSEKVVLTNELIEGSGEPDWREKQQQRPIERNEIDAHIERMEAKEFCVANTISRSVQRAEKKRES
jgi:hypothetical protein